MQPSTWKSVNIKEFPMGRCSKCGNNHNRGGQRYCYNCHATYTREWRKGRPLTSEQRFKDNAKSYASEYKRRGLLIPEPCKVCGSTNVEMSHLDYEQPLLVEWYCREHRLELGRHLKGATAHS